MEWWGGGGIVREAGWWWKVREIPRGRKRPNLRGNDRAPARPPAIWRNCRKRLHVEALHFSPDPPPILDGGGRGGRRRVKLK